MDAMITAAAVSLGRLVRFGIFGVAAYFGATWCGATPAAAGIVGAIIILCGVLNVLAAPATSSGILLLVAGCLWSFILPPDVKGSIGNVVASALERVSISVATDKTVLPNNANPEGAAPEGASSDIRISSERAASQEAKDKKAGEADH